MKPGATATVATADLAQLKPQREKLAVVGKSPEISWTHLERLEPGEYPAYSRSAKVYRDRQFKRWVCAVQFDVFDESLMNVLARLTWYLNLGSKEKPHAGRRTNFWAAWVKANGGPPKRRDRLSHTVFVGRQAL